tara:strand:- start:427 stop:762 length:336 start_codon:yes stop_codon:yes gene_type:complete
MESADMEMNQYQEAARKTAIYPDEYGLVYTVLGLNGEAGEIAEKIKKSIRDNQSLEEIKPALIDEIGDVLWYVANLAHEVGISMNEVAIRNINKLQSRSKRNVLHGDGDNR